MRQLVRDVSRHSQLVREALDYVARRRTFRTHPRNRIARLGIRRRALCSARDDEHDLAFDSLTEAVVQRPYGSATHLLEPLGELARERRRAIAATRFDQILQR